MNYGTLKSTIANFINRSDLTSVIPTFISLAALDLYRERNIATAELSATHTLADGEDTLEYPPNYKAYLQAWIKDGSDKLHRPVFLSKTNFDRVVLTSDTQVLLRNPGDLLLSTAGITDGAPLAICDFGGRLLLYPTVANDGVGKTIELDYYSILPYDNLVDTYEDELFRLGWDVLMYGALMKAEPYLGSDERIEKWREDYNKALRAFMVYSAGKREVSTTSPLQ